MNGRSTRAAAALVIDQALYSGSNFAFVLAQSRRSSPADFAAFAAASGLLVLVVASGRYLFHEPAMAGASPPVQRVAGITVRTEWLFRAAATAAIIVVALVLGDGALGLACVTPLVLAQDQRRYALFSDGAANVAVVADAVWAVGVLPMLFVSSGVDARSVWWGIAAGTSWLVTWLPHASVGAPDASLRVSAPRRYLVIDFLINELSVPVGLVLLAGSSHPDSAAAFRVVLIPFGVLWVAVGALRSLGIAEHRRLGADDRQRRARLISAVSVVLAVLLWIVLRLAAPATWARLLGSSWPLAGLIVTFAGVLHVAKAAQTGALLGLKADARFREVSAVRVLCGLLPMLVGWVAAFRGSASGLMAALAVGELLTAFVLSVIVADRVPTRMRAVLGTGAR